MGLFSDYLLRSCSVSSRGSSHPQGLGQSRRPECIFPVKASLVLFNYLLGVVIDVMDSYMKGGWTYIMGQGVLGWAYPVANISVVAIGLRSTGIGTHTIMGIVSIVWLVVFGFEFAPLLHR